ILLKVSVGRGSWGEGPIPPLASNSKLMVEGGESALSLTLGPTSNSSGVRVMVGGEGPPIISCISSRVWSAYHPALSTVFIEEGVSGRLYCRGVITSPSPEIWGEEEVEEEGRVLDVMSTMVRKFAMHPLDIFVLLLCRVDSSLFLFRKSLMRSGALTCSSGSQESWESEYPFHRIRNWVVCPRLRSSRICSTSHSSSPSMRSGGGSWKLMPYSSVSLYGCKSFAWKTSWIFHWGVNSNRYLT